MKTLTLPLKRKWFDMIKAGIKKEEYRDIKPYYEKRLLEPFSSRLFRNGETGVKSFDRLVFTLGYPKAGDTERMLVFKNPKIRIDTGKPEWGAEPGKLYYVIKWEE